MCDYPNCGYTFMLTKGVVSYFVEGIQIEEVRNYCRVHTPLLAWVKSVT